MGEERKERCPTCNRGREDCPDSFHAKDTNAELERLRRWVNDLQSGMYVNCVYCGHRYGPGDSTPVSMADVLKEHVERCPEHPMSAMREELEFLRWWYTMADHCSSSVSPLERSELKELWKRNTGKEFPRGYSDEDDLW